jgi:hypothetical protein
MSSLRRAPHFGEASRFGGNDSRKAGVCDDHQDLCLGAGPPVGGVGLGQPRSPFGCGWQHPNWSWTPTSLGRRATLAGAHVAVRCGVGAPCTDPPGRLARLTRAVFGLRARGFGRRRIAPAGASAYAAAFGSPLPARTTSWSGSESLSPPGRLRLLRASARVQDSAQYVHVRPEAHGSIERAGVATSRYRQRAPWRSKALRSPFAARHSCRAANPTTRGNEPR